MGLKTDSAFNICHYYKLHDKKKTSDVKETLISAHYAKYTKSRFDLQAGFGLITSRTNIVIIPADKQHY